MGSVDPEVEKPSLEVAAKIAGDVKCVVDRHVEGHSRVPMKSKDTSLRGDAGRNRSRAGLPGISANVLTQRLAGLEAAGVLVRRKLPPAAAAQVYELTEWGCESEPIFQALGRWAARSTTHDPSLPLSAVSLLLSLRTMLDAPRAEGNDARIGFRLGEETFTGHLADGRIEFARGTLDDADVIFTGAPPVLAAAIYGGQALGALEQAGALRVEGDRVLAERFVTFFPLPPKA